MASKRRKSSRTSSKKTSSKSRRTIARSDQDQVLAAEQLDAPSQASEQQVPPVAPDATQSIEREVGARNLHVPTTSSANEEAANIVVRSGDEVSTVSLKFLYKAVEMLDKLDTKMSQCKEGKEKNRNEASKHEAIKIDPRDQEVMIGLRWEAVPHRFFKQSYSRLFHEYFCPSEDQV